MKRGDPASGDGMLSAMDRKLWSLAYGCAVKFACPAIFKVEGPDARLGLDRHIRFFVPRGRPRAAEAAAWLREELKSELRAPAEAGLGRHWGCFVSVHEFFPTSSARRRRPSRRAWRSGSPLPAAGETRGGLRQ
jgi:hypothetical protein